MKIVCIGDSLTEGDYGVFGKTGVMNVHKENYPYYLEKFSHCEVKNYGVCGATSTGYLEYYKQGNVCVCNADIVLVMLGTNTCLFPDKECESNKNYEALIDLVLKDMKNGRVILLTPPHATDSNPLVNTNFCEVAKNAGIFVKRVASKKGLHCIDMQCIPEFTAENESIMQPNDGLHFSKTGYRVMANYIFDKLKEIKVL